MSDTKPQNPLATHTPNDLIRLAVEKDLDIEKMQKLLDLRERWEAGEARKAYVEAMAAFKREVPSVLPKDALVDFTSAKGRTRYKHATLGGIEQRITPALSKHGLSVSWETKQSQTLVEVTCHVTHAAGHRESTSLSGPPDDSGNKNRIQQIGSAITYLQRYTLLAALGLSTSDMDDADDPVPMPRRKSEPRPAVVETVTETPEAAPERAQDQAAGGFVTGPVTEIKTIKSPATAKKPWTLYAVSVGGSSFCTFDAKIADIAAQAEAEQREVEIDWVPGNKPGSKKIEEIRIKGKDDGGI